jgi:hypothetical protein
MVAYLNVEQRIAGEARVARRRPRFLGRDSHVAYAFIAPAFFLLAVLVAYPFVLSVWFSLSDARVGNAGSFVGLTNFSHLLSSSIFLQTLQNTIVFTAAALAAKTVFGMGLALLLFRVVRPLDTAPIRQCGLRPTPQAKARTKARLSRRALGFPNWRSPRSSPDQGQCR